MKKIILMVTYIFMLTSVNLFALTGDDLMNALCNGEKECSVCQDAPYGKEPVFAPCKSYGTFNKDKVVVAENLDTVIGNYDEDKISKACPMIKFKEKCIVDTTTTNVPTFIDFEYTWTAINEYDDIHELHDKGMKGTAFTVDRNLTNVIIDQYNKKNEGLRINYPSLNLLAEIKKTIKTDIDLDALKKTPVILNYRTLRYTFISRWSARGSASVLPGNKAGIGHYKKGILAYPVINIRVPVRFKKEDVDVYCKSDQLLPCVSENKGKDYFCSTSPCGVISGDINLDPDQILPTDNSTPTDNITVEDNVTSCDVNDIVLFPGKQYECRHKGEGILSNDLTSPNQCLISDLDDNTKKAMLDGLNKFFDATSLGGGLGYLVAPGQLLIKLFTEGIIENIADMPTDEEKQLSVLRAVSDNNGSCVIIGEYCKDWTKGYTFDYDDNSECKRRSSIYCCYDSPLAKAFNVAARDQIPKEISWGENLKFIDKYLTYQKNPPRPNCRGITVDELGKINMDDPQFSEDMKSYVENVLVPEMEEDDGLLDPVRLEGVQQKMQDDMKEFYE